MYFNHIHVIEYRKKWTVLLATFHKMVKFDTDMYTAESSTIMEAQWVKVWIGEKSGWGGGDRNKRQMMQDIPARQNRYRPKFPVLNMTKTTKCLISLYIYTVNQHNLLYV